MTEADEPPPPGDGPAFAGQPLAHPLGRDERLAARLRDNLRRRKAQARARIAPDDALSKPPPSS